MSDSRSDEATTNDDSLESVSSVVTIVPGNASDTGDVIR
jgi:hypothetical protein